LMKRSDHVREIRLAARAAELDLLLVREGAEHEVWGCGDVQIAIPRHRELTPGVVGDNRRKLVAVLGEGWWRK
jgi:hypothetical protein